MGASVDTREKLLSPLLERSHYLNAGWYGRELDQIFKKGWVGIGVGAQVPEPNSTHPVTVAGQPLLLTRDANGALHVFQNVCRHRGLKLVEESCRSRLLTCPYHQWAFETDGRVASTPYWDQGDAASKPGPEARERLRLIEVRFAVWMDVIFVNLSGDAEPFEDFIAPLETRWAALDRDDLNNFHWSPFSANANWKLGAENFLDFYHLFAVHAVGNCEDHMNYSEVVLSDDLFGVTYPAAGAELGWKPPGRPLPHFRGIREDIALGMDQFGIFPNTYLILAGCWYQVILLLPDGPNRIDEVFALYGPAELLEKNRTRSDEIERLLVEVNSQDIPILNRLQEGRRSPATDQTVFLDAWERIPLHFQRRVIGVVGSRSGRERRE